MCLSSPPYWQLRDNGTAGQIGLEATLDAYVHELVGVFREVWRVLRNNGTLWLNLGDSYSAGGRGGGVPGDKQHTNKGSALPPFRCDLPPKNLLGMPWRVALALQANRWILRSAIVWHKLAVMPESVRDRPTSAYELLFCSVRAGGHSMTRMQLQRTPNRKAPSAINMRFQAIQMGSTVPVHYETPRAGWNSTGSATAGTSGKSTLSRTKERISR
jgi:hypothetical protein